MNIISINSNIKVHVINAAIAAALFLLFITSGPAGASDEPEKLMIAGSTSVQPIAEKLAEHFMQKHPGIKIEVQGGGSSAGVQAAYSGAADIGMSSRELKIEEKQLKEFVAAYDAIVLIAHRDNAIENISREDARKIFSFDITSWKDVSGSTNEGVITVLTREDGSGTRGAFEELIMGTAEIAARALVQDSTGSIREIVSNDIDGLGYISFGSLNDRVKALAVDGVKPEMKSFQAKDGAAKYKVIRPFLFLTREEPAGAAKEFMRFIRSAEGVELIKKEGLVPAL